MTLDHLGRSEEAISSFLDTLSLDMDNSRLLTNHVVSLAGNLCDLSDEKIEKLKGVVKNS